MSVNLKNSRVIRWHTICFDYIRSLHLHALEAKANIGTWASMPETSASGMSSKDNVNPVLIAIRGEKSIYIWTKESKTLCKAFISHWTSIMRLIQIDSRISERKPIDTKMGHRVQDRGKYLAPRWTDPSDHDGCKVRSPIAGPNSWLRQNHKNI